MIFNCHFLSQNSGSTVKAFYIYDPILMRCLNFHVSFKLLIVYIIHTCVCKNLERLLRDAFRMNKFIKKINSSFYPIMIQNFTDWFSHKKLLSFSLCPLFVFWLLPGFLFYFFQLISLKLSLIYSIVNYTNDRTNKFKWRLKNENFKIKVHAHWTTTTNGLISTESGGWNVVFGRRALLCRIS